MNTSIWDCSRRITFAFCFWLFWDQLCGGLGWDKPCERVKYVTNHEYCLLNRPISFGCVQLFLISLPHTDGWREQHFSAWTNRMTFLLQAFCVCWLWSHVDTAEIISYAMNTFVRNTTPNHTGIKLKPTLFHDRHKNTQLSLETQYSKECISQTHAH